MTQNATEALSTARWVVSVFLCLLCVSVVSSVAVAQPSSSTPPTQAPVPAASSADPQEAATLQQVNTYLLQTIAKLRQSQEALQAKLTTLGEANARLNALLKDQSKDRRTAQLAHDVQALRQQLVQAAQERQASKKELDTFRETTIALQARLATLIETNKKNQQAGQTLQRLQEDHRALTQEARALKGQAQRSRSLEKELAHLRQALVAAQEEIEHSRRLGEERLTLQANLTALTEETRQREQVMQELVAKLQQAQQLVQEQAHFKLEADTLRETLQRDRGELYRELGALYTKARLFDRAINAYQQSLEADPDHAQTHYHLGLLYQHAKNNDERAVAHLQRYLALSPTLSPKPRKEIEYVINVLQMKETAPSKEREPKPQVKP